MRHRKRKKRFECRTMGHRKALMRSLLSALFLHQKIKTTVARTKEVRRAADKLVTLGKRSTLHARRQAFEVLQDKALVKKLFEKIAPAFKRRAGGYTRTIRISPRHGDGAEMAILELTELIAVPERGKIKPAGKPRQPLKEEVKPKEKKEKAIPEKKEKAVAEKKEKAVAEKKEKAVPEKKEKKTSGFLEGLRKRFRPNR